MGVATAIIGSALLSAGVSGYSAYKQNKEQKKLQKEQDAYQAEQEAVALEERKTVIDQQREQTGIGAYSTKKTGTTGIKGKVPTATDTLG